VALPDNSRAYMIAGTQHGGRAGATTEAGPNVNPRNPHNPMAAVRALLVALEEWVVSGRPPPPSRVPTLAEGTLVEPDKTGFPDIPGAAVVRRTNQVAPASDWVKPAPSARAYRTLVSRVDPDGNEVAGIRLPDIAVPLATQAGWNYRHASIGAPDRLAGEIGSYIPFAQTRAARERASDPRPSIEERYRGRDDYVGKLAASALDLVERGYLLPEDVPDLLKRAAAHYDWSMQSRGTAGK